MKKQSAARALVTEQMPDLPEGYYFKVKNWNLSYDYEIVLYRTRLKGWWPPHRVDYTLAYESNVVSCMEGLAYKVKPGTGSPSLAGKYRKRVYPVEHAFSDALTGDKEVHYDEATQTFTLSDELIERLKNGE